MTRRQGSDALGIIVGNIHTKFFAESSLFFNLFFLFSNNIDVVVA